MNIQSPCSELRLPGESAALSRTWNVVSRDRGLVLCQRRNELLNMLAQKPFVRGVNKEDVPYVIKHLLTTRRLRFGRIRRRVFSTIRNSRGYADQNIDGKTLPTSLNL